MPATHYSPEGNWIACGLPSPGSRLQSIVRGLSPATVDSVLTTADLDAVTCKRCRKSEEFRRARHLIYDAKTAGLKVKIDEINRRLLKAPLGATGSIDERLAATGAD